jgi:hypothetical protein
MTVPGKMEFVDIGCLAILPERAESFPEGRLIFFKDELFLVFIHKRNEGLANKLFAFGFSFMLEVMYDMLEGLDVLVDEFDDWMPDLKSYRIVKVIRVTRI